MPLRGAWIKRDKVATSVIPANVGIHSNRHGRRDSWIPAFAGMTGIARLSAPPSTFRGRIETFDCAERFLAQVNLREEVTMADLDIAKDTRWQDVGNLVLGVWLFLSPWILGFADVALAAPNAWLFGVIVAILAVLAIFAYQKWEEWLNAAIGVWVFISPWVLGAAANANALWNSLIVGALLVILALWSVSLEHGHGRIATRS
jgi:hypothetical protein